MACVRVTGEFSIVLRCAALDERGVAWDAVLSVLEARQPMDSNEQIATFGPNFGQEALDTAVRRLMDLGLQYFDDFFEFVGDFPSWCEFRVCDAQIAKTPC
jgi:hypothetical protein